MIEPTEQQLQAARIIAEAMYIGMRRLKYTKADMDSTFDELVGIHQACMCADEADNMHRMLLGEVREVLDCATVVEGE